VRCRNWKGISVRIRLRRGGLRLGLLGLLVGSVVLTLVVSSALAGGGNSANAKKCQKNGYLTLVRANGSTFATEQECTSYAAKGGVLYPSTAAPCLGTGYQTKATANGDPFASIDACVAYMNANPGKLVSCTVVGTSGNDTFPGGVVVCGFGGDDKWSGLDFVQGQTFYGGCGADTADVPFVDCTFIGGDGNDSVTQSVFGTYDGGAGDDSTVWVATGGTFHGGAGNDSASEEMRGTFNGGAGNDSARLVTGTFNGGAGNDFASEAAGVFNGGDGDDRLDLLIRDLSFPDPAVYDGGADTDTLCGDDTGGFGVVTNVEITSCPI